MNDSNDPRSHDPGQSSPRDKNDPEQRELSEADLAEEYGYSTEDPEWPEIYREHREIMDHLRQTNDTAPGIYFLVRRGHVQRFPNVTIAGVGRGKIWPIAESHEDAAKLAKFFKCPEARPALIGSIEGETLEGHCRLAIEEGCIAICCVAGWNEDGSPRWKYIALE